MINLDYILEDDSTDFGGTEHSDETLREFLDSINMKYDTPLCIINKALKSCGIKPIKGGKDD